MASELEAPIPRYYVRVCNVAVGIDRPNPPTTEQASTFSGTFVRVTVRASHGLSCSRGDNTNDDDNC